MLERFKGTDGKQLLIKALLSHSIVCNEESLASEIAEVGELQAISKGTDLMVQDGEDNEVYFIITGSFGILVNGREMAIRSAGTHVGEMALIEPTGKRSATVKAYEESVVLKVVEPVFSRLAIKYPTMWRDIALTLGDRLRQRNKHVKTPNPKPDVFIASSSEGLKIARAIQLGLEHDDCVITVWTDGVFGASTFPIEGLEAQINKSDFGVLVISADDQVLSRGTDSMAPRDNVIFELGMCIGAFGRDRSFIVTPKDLDLKIPTDLLGLTPIPYGSDTAIEIDVRVATVCEKLRREFSNKGVK